VNYRLAAFCSASVDLPGIAEWLGVTGLSIERPFDNDRLSLTYELPSDITVVLTDDLSLAFRFWWRAPFSSSKRLVAQVEQGVRLKVTSAQGAGYHDLYSTLTRLSNFFTLVLNHLLSFREVTVESDEFLIETPDSSLRQPIVSTAGSYERATTSRELHTHEMLFRFSDIESNFATMIRTWYERYELLKPALNIYFSLERRETVYMEQRFLSLVQALEALHRRTNPIGASSTHTTRLEEILGAAPEAHREWLKRELAYSHEPSLRRRLTDLLKPFRAIFGNERERNRFVSRVVDTRNYLTHYDEASRRKAVEPSKLWPYMYLLRLLFVLRCLTEIGFDADEARRIVTENNALHQYRQLGLEGINRDETRQVS